MKELSLPFPNVEFQALLTEIAAAKPDAVYTFFAGGGAVKFVKDYAAAGLKKTIPLVGAGFLTDGTLEAQGDSAQRPAHHDALRRRSHGAQGQDIPRRVRRRLQDAAGRLRGARLRRRAAARHRTDRGQGDFSEAKELYAAMGSAKIDSPRGAFTLGKHHVRCRTSTCAVEGKENKVIGVAVEVAGRSRAAAARCSVACAAAVARLPLVGDPERRRPRRSLFSDLAWSWQLLTPHGSAHLPRPVPERAAVRAAAVPGRQRPDADLRDHGRDQSGARQLLHDRRVPRVFARAGVRRQFRSDAAGGISCWR